MYLLQSKVLWEEATKKLEQVYESTEAREIAFRLLQSLTGFSKTDFLLNREITNFNRDFYIEAIKRLLNNEPLQYVEGFTSFCNLRFKVNRSVLIPRPETEELVNIIIKENQSYHGQKVIDIGTGSGCIPISLAKNLTTPEVFAIDISLPALQTAKENATLNQVKIDFLNIDILNGSIPDYLDNLDILISNPPYVLEDEKNTIKSNVLNYEPHSALFVPDRHPLLFYEKILEKFGYRIKKGGRIYFEINENKGLEVEQLLKKNNFSNIQIRKDFNNKVRFAIATL